MTNPRELGIEDEIQPLASPRVSYVRKVETLTVDETGAEHYWGEVYIGIDASGQMMERRVSLTSKDQSAARQQSAVQHLRELRDKAAARLTRQR